MHLTQVVKVGDILIGGDNKISIQSMTNTLTSDIDATYDQIIELYNAGSELVRITVNDDKAAEGAIKIITRLRENGVSVPIVGDFHYNGHLLLSKYEKLGILLDKYRINPGNVGFDTKRDLNFESIIKIAIKNDKPVRIGVNWGSLDKALTAYMMNENAKNGYKLTTTEVMRNAIVESAIGSARLAEKFGMPHNKIVLSCKTSSPIELINVNQMLANMCDYPIHLGLTEAGMGLSAAILITSGMSPLLAQGIGNTIRCSITPEPGASRIGEVLLCKNILQSLDLRKFTPTILSCPGCGRTNSDLFILLSQEIKNYVAKKESEWNKKYLNIGDLKIAVMGCIVNGPGESKHANIGISMPGSGEDNKAVVFADGEKLSVLHDNISENFKKLIEEYLELRWPKL